MGKTVLFNIQVDANFTQLVKLENELRDLRKQRSELIKLQKTETGLTRDQNKQLTALNLRISEQTKQKTKLGKEIQRVNKERRNEISQYDKESARLNRLRKELKDVILTKGETGRAARRLAKRVQTLDRRLKNVDAAAGQFQRNVGNYQSGFKGLGASIGTAAIAATGMIGGFQLAVRVIGGAINIVKDFQQANANLASVLATATTAEMDSLRESAKNLGSTTSFSATQVVELQTEFAKLGLSAKQIEAAQAATLNLAAATGSDLAEAAAIAGATLGGFGLEAVETQRITDVMAKSFSTSALDIDKFRESMKTAAPAARAVGVDVETTTALLGTLANAGISGSKAGTSLATSFINLNTKGLTLQQGLEKVNTSANKLQTAVDLVGKEAAKAFLVLAEGTETTAELEEGLNNAGGAAERMANVQLDTLDGAIKILNSSWEGLILSFEDGEGVIADLSKLIINDLAVGLGVLTGNFDEADKKLSFFALQLTSVKNGFALTLGALKLLTIPWRILIDLATRLAQKFGFVSEDVGDFEDALLSAQRVFIRLPQIIDFIIDGITDSFLGLTDVVIEVGKLIAKAFNPVQLTADILAGKKPLENAFESIGKAATDAFSKGVGGVGQKIKKLFEDDIDFAAFKRPKKEAEDLGKDLADDVVKGFGDSLQKGLREEFEKIDLVPERITDIVEDLKNAIQTEIEAGDPITLDDIQLGKISPEERQLLKDQAVLLAQQTADAVFQVQKDNNERRKQFEIDQLKIQTSRDQDILQGRLDSQTISQAEFENNRIALEQETQDARRQIELEAFQRNKRIQIAQAIANGALAITSILATSPDILKPIGPLFLTQLAGVVGATAIQVAAINAQKFGSGGVAQGRTHTQGGIPAIVGGSTPVEIEHGEAIINAASTRKHLPLLSRINMDGGGVPLMARGGLPSPKFQVGGIASGINPVDLRRIVKEVTTGVVNTLRVENVATETADVAAQVNNLQNDLSN